MKHGKVRDGCHEDIHQKKPRSPCEDVFLSAEPANVDTFLEDIKGLPSPLREQIFVLCCLSQDVDVAWVCH